jgi:hypothetical protein
MSRFLTTVRSCLGLRVLSIAWVIALTVTAAAQTSPDRGENEFWPAFRANFELGPKFRLTAIVEKRDGEEDAFQLWRVGTMFSYHAFRRIKRPDADIEEADRHYVVVAAGYELLVSEENGTTSREHRVIARVTPKRSIGGGFVIQDRNQMEFRWKDTAYNFRYRNKLAIDRPLEMGRLLLIPYASGELFWDRNAHAWNQNRSAVGVRLPFKKSWVIDPYYMRKNCSGCTRSRVHVFGLTVNWYFRKAKT